MNAIEAALNELAGFELFAGYEKNQILELCHSGQIISSNHRDFLFHYGKEAHFFGIILSGAYKLTKPSPKAKMSSFILPHPEKRWLLLLWLNPHLSILFRLLPWDPLVF